MASPRIEVPKGMRTFGSKFLDEVRKSGETFRKNSRLVAQNYSD